MSVSAGAALKRIATAIITSGEEKRGSFGKLLGWSFGIIFFPVIMLTAIFSDFDDSSPFLSNLKSQCIALQNAKIELIETTSNSIYSSMIENGYTILQAQEAQNIYMVLFINKSTDDNFVDSFVNCFTSDISNENFCANLNAAFGTNITPEMLAFVRNSVSVTYISTDNYVDVTTKNSTDLVQWALEAEENHWGYVWGTSGNILSLSRLESLAELYPEQVGAEKYYDFINENWVGKRTADCAGLIKGYMWLDVNSHEVVYGSNNFADVNSDDMYNNATEKGEMDTMPDIPGICVWHTGHVGIYIGDGVVIEARGTKTGVVKSDLANAKWTNWFKVPDLIYEDDTTNTEENETSETEETSESTTEVTTIIETSATTEVSEPTEIDVQETEN